MPQKGLQLLTCCGVLSLPAACMGLGGLQDRQPFPGFTHLAAEHVLVPIRILLSAAITRADPEPSSPPQSGWGHGDAACSERDKHGRSCAVFVQLPWLPQDSPGAHRPGACDPLPRLRLQGTGQREGPPASLALAPPAARPELVSLWEGTKQFLSFSFLPL